MSLRSEIIKTIKDNRPNISDSSIRTYTSVLLNIPAKLKADIKNIKVDWYNDKVDDIIKYYKDTKPSLRKSKLASLYILTNNPKYQKLMKEDIL